MWPYKKYEQEIENSFKKKKKREKRCIKKREKKRDIQTS
jgi:hypothetical protein